MIDGPSENCAELRDELRRRIARRNCAAAHQQNESQLSPSSWYGRSVWPPLYTGLSSRWTWATSSFRPLARARAYRSSDGRRWNLRTFSIHPPAAAASSSMSSSASHVISAYVSSFHLTRNSTAPSSAPSASLGRSATSLSTCVYSGGKGSTSTWPTVPAWRARCHRVMRAPPCGSASTSCSDSHTQCMCDLPRSFTRYSSAPPIPPSPSPSPSPSAPPPPTSRCASSFSMRDCTFSGAGAATAPPPPSEPLLQSSSPEPGSVYLPTAPLRPGRRTTFFDCRPLAPRPLSSLQPSSLSSSSSSSSSSLSSESEPRRRRFGFAARRFGGAARRFRGPP